MSVISLLCEKHTHLGDSDIKILEEFALQLPYIVELTGNDVFIDALTYNSNDSIVLAWARPKDKSLYSTSVVGELAHPSSEPAVYRTLKTGETTRDVRGLSQEGVPIAQTVVPIFNAQEKIIGVLIMERDISKELQEQEKVEFLSDTAEKLSSTLMFLSMTEATFEEWLGNGIFVLNTQGKITYVNKNAAQIYKVHCSTEALGSNFFTLIGKCSSIKELLEHLKSSMELTLGEQCYCLRSYPLVTRGELSGCVVSFDDVTDLRKKEQELNAKSIIIREIHHRVKNNLQNIAALLRLQMRRSSSDVVRNEFAACINRIISISQVYDVFAREDFDTINITELSQRILDCLMENSTISRERIITRVEGQSVELPSQQAVPLALVINELTTNSIKHGIEPTGNGEITIHLKESNGIITLVVNDNGNKFPESGQLSKKGLGLKIIEALVHDQLNGVFRLEHTAGFTRALVSFPKHCLEGEI